MTKTQFNKIAKCIRSDRGREYVNADLQNYLTNLGVKIQYTVPYTPQQNGVAERKNRSLMEMARCMLLDSNLEKKYGAEAVNTENFLQNRLPTRSTEKTPYELWYSRKPNVQNLHVFGCSAYVQIPKDQRRKLGDKTEELTFIGYSEKSKGFRFLQKGTNRVKISHDVIFLDKMYAAQETGNAEIHLSSNINETSDKTNEMWETSTIISQGEEEESDQEREEESETIKLEEEAEENNQIKPEEPKTRQSTRTNKGVPPNWYTDTSKYTTILKEDPKTTKEALAGTDKEKWKGAMDEEIDALKKNGTWDIVPAPKDANIVTCK